MTRYGVDLSTGEVVEAAERREPAYADFSDHSGLSDWLEGKEAEAAEAGPPAREHREGRPFLDAEGAARLAAEPDAELPESVREDAELREALLAQAREERFGSDPSDELSDAELLARYREALGTEEA